MVTGCPSALLPTKSTWFGGSGVTYLGISVWGYRGIGRVWCYRALGMGRERLRGTGVQGYGYRDMVCRAHGMGLEGAE